MDDWNSQDPGWRSSRRLQFRLDPLPHRFPLVWLFRFGSLLAETVVLINGLAGGLKEQTVGVLLPHTCQHRPFPFIWRRPGLSQVSPRTVLILAEQPHHQSIGPVELGVRFRAPVEEVLG